MGLLRTIRKLAQDRFLIKIKKGVYKYDPDFIENRVLEDFTPEQKKRILKRDGDKYVSFGKGKENGIELHIDHIKPKEFEGKVAVKNGQVLYNIIFRKKL